MWNQMSPTKYVWVQGPACCPISGIMCLQHDIAVMNHHTIVIIGVGVSMLTISFFVCLEQS